MTPSRCHEFIDSIAQATTVEQIHDVCSELCAACEFEQFIYAASVPTSFVKPSLIVISGYTKEWRDHYNEQQFMAVDPTVAYCAKNILPLDWGNLSTDLKADAKLGRFMSDAQDFGLNSGVSFPVHTAQGDAAMLSLASVEEHRVTESRILTAMPYGQLFAAHVHEAVRRVFSSELLPLTQADLTQREQQCLLWVTEGKTTWETSQILNISERTVTFHLQNAADKMGVINRQQAVARAVAMGLITPQYN